MILQALHHLAQVHLRALVEAAAVVVLAPALFLVRLALYRYHVLHVHALSRALLVQYPYHALLARARFPAQHVQCQSPALPAHVPFLQFLVPPAQSHVLHAAAVLAHQVRVVAALAHLRAHVVAVPAHLRALAALVRHRAHALAHLRAPARSLRSHHSQALAHQAAAHPVPSPPSHRSRVPAPRVQVSRHSLHFRAVRQAVAAHLAHSPPSHRSQAHVLQAARRVHVLPAQVHHQAAVEDVTVMVSNAITDGNLPL